MRRLAAPYASIVRCLVRCSGVRLVNTAISGRNDGDASNWKLETSQTVHPSPLAADRGTPNSVLPASSAPLPAARSTAAISFEVVDLPFVPVTPTIGELDMRQPSSSSSITR